MSMATRKLDRDKELRNLFKHMDINDDELLDKHEIVILIRNLIGKKVESKFATKTMNTMDTDKDGVVNIEEFVNYLGKNMMKFSDVEFGDKIEVLKFGRRELTIETLFHLWDINGNGVLDANEFSKMIYLSKSKFLEPKVILKKYFDTGEETSTKSVNLEEFKDFTMLVLGRLDDKHFYVEIEKMKKTAIRMWAVLADSKKSLEPIDD